MSDSGNATIGGLGFYETRKLDKKFFPIVLKPFRFKICDPAIFLD